MTYQQMIFVNLAVKDLSVSRKFFTDLGYPINEQFSDEHTTSVVISDAIVVMLLENARFQEFTPSGKGIVDASKSNEVLVALSAESREKVDELSDKALASGATPAREPEDHGFMYGRSFQDPDGHVWEVVWMDPASIKG
ncbi:VOC family protein [Streptomyces sp. NPDC049954]|uniref:VOC family protein n=1 Tax=Streptomyces sp. NPDC049954 TaxID=3155779 RepID=UPI00343AA412